MDFDRLVRGNTTALGPTYVIVGLGSLGRHILFGLSRLSGPKTIVVATRSVDHASRLCRLARLAAATSSTFVKAIVRDADLTQRGRLA